MSDAHGAIGKPDNPYLTAAEFDGCRSDCRKAAKHTLVWGECEHAVEPPPQPPFVWRTVRAEDGQLTIVAEPFDLDAVRQPLLDRIAQLETQLESIRERRFGTEDGTHKIERWILERDDALGALDLAEKRVNELNAALAQLVYAATIFRDGEEAELELIACDESQPATTRLAALFEAHRLVVANNHQLRRGWCANPAAHLPPTAGDKVTFTGQIWGTDPDWQWR